MNTNEKEFFSAPTINEYNTVTDLIRKRRSIYADEFIKKDITDDLLKEILTNATWAPTHKMTEPWRFLVFKEKRLEELGIFLAEYYSDYYSEKLPEDQAIEKYNFLLNYPLNAACVIGIILVRNPKLKLPEWEEIAAVSSAVQNMALTCTAYGLGGYWSTPQGAIDFVEKFGLNEHEKSLGLFYIGHFDQASHRSAKKRTQLDKKVTWLS
ncbi:nitroreductase [Rapidithrix thailandica]|uniref:Nitroreductase n=1 Tax=Rapidithrix thailandica TaxID=413964 RepID=A0AAW9SEY3_9BACT